MAVVAAVSVANLYYAQPLGATMAHGLHVGAGSMGVALMLCQVGYALGMLLLVPLGDGRERRALMAITALAAGAMLLLTAIVPGFDSFAAVSLALGFASCLPQMAVSFAVGAVPPAERGKAIGTVMSGLLAGILLSRTASGSLAAAIGWRGTFAAAAGLMVGLAAMIRFMLPPQVPARPLAWRTVLASLPEIVRREPLLRRHALVGAAGFAAFSAFWSTLSFQLARLGYGSRTAGLFGVLGLTGVAVAPIVGRLTGRVRPAIINSAGLLASAGAFVLFWAGAQSLTVLAVGVVALDAGVQGSHLANQGVIFGLNPDARNRVNAIYMVTYFIGGALGTVLSGWAWDLAGWGGVCVAGMVFSAAGLLPLLGRLGGQRAASTIDTAASGSPATTSGDSARSRSAET
jgi:predicted MFS family arabinose efflux permease